MRIWIDLANAPHVRFFEPVYEELGARGHDLLLTVRDHRETATLARTVWPDVEPDSGSSPNDRVQKGAAFLGRAWTLARRARRFRPDVAVSHNSYAQILAARLLGISSVTAMDYEHQPANHLAFRLASRVVVPRAFPEAALRRYGASPGRVRRYDGFKEELYLPRRTEEAGERARIGVQDGIPLAVLRLPPHGALYHRDANELVEDVVATLRGQGAAVVVLARSDEQRASWRARAGEGLIVPDPPVRTQALLEEADLFVGAGGTMTREAALLGTPTVSIFGGETPAVDRELERLGRLRIVRDRAGVGGIALSGNGRLAPLVTEGETGPLSVLLSTIEELGPPERS